MKRILVIAGSDSSGGAGLEADQKVIAAHGCYAMTATTALTAQNTQGVYAIRETPSEFVQKQIDACVEDIGVDTVKTGMLASASIVAVVADILRKYKIATSVIDPVMVATSGARLLPQSAVKTLCDRLLPETFLLTPNISEANLILEEVGQPSVQVNDLEDMKRLGNSIRKLGPRWVLIKGGHVPLTAGFKVASTDPEKKIVVNVVCGPEATTVVQSPYQNSRNTHGTGCSLACVLLTASTCSQTWANSMVAAIACHLAQGKSTEEAVRAACRYIDGAIKHSVEMGKGHGPLNHFYSLQKLPFAPNGFIDYLLERDDVRPAWREYTHHEFVRKLGDGSLPLESFKEYMQQDYLYLIQFARANALASYKARTLEEVADCAAKVLHIKEEMELHITECEGFGISKEEMENHEENLACTAYSRWVLDVGESEDWLALQMSMLPCLLGYGMIARRLKDELNTTSPAKPNRFIKWIDNYIALDYVTDMGDGCAKIEKFALMQSPSRIEELVRIFIKGTRLETEFWEMALHPPSRCSNPAAPPT